MSETKPIHFLQRTNNMSGTKKTKRKREEKKQEKEEAKDLKLLLAQSFDPAKHDPRGYWMSEKMDGVRGYWDGRQFLSRLGNRFHVPASFCAHFPKDKCLDGEFFTERNDFANIVSILKTQYEPNDPEELAQWSTIRFHAFDIPSMEQEPFEIRLQALKQLEMKMDPTVFTVVNHVKCKSTEHLQEFLEDVTKRKGEGVMLREPKSWYERKRSRTLLKMKKSFEMDVLVVNHTPGKGKHEGSTGALIVQTRKGVQFCVGSGLTDEGRAHPPAIGTVVNVRYTEIIAKTGRPRFPTFVGERLDVQPWPAVVQKTKPKKTE